MARRYNQSVLAELIETARNNLGLTQWELGARVGRGQQAVAKWETDQSKPRPDLMPVLAEALGLPSDVLLSEAGYISTGVLDGQNPAVEQRLPDGTQIAIQVNRPASSFRHAVDTPEDPDDEDVDGSLAALQGVARSLDPAVRRQLLAIAETLARRP